MVKQDSEQANFNLRDLTMGFILKSAPVKIFFWLLFLEAVFLLLLILLSKINPGVGLVIFVVSIGWCFYRLFGFLPEHAEIFQDSRTWLGYQKLLLGSKQTGLQELLPKTELLQPVIQKRTNLARANIAKAKQK